MKKLQISFLTTVAIFISVLFAPFAMASDCFHDPILEKDMNGEVKSAVFVRDVPCMEGSVVLTTLGAGEIVYIYEYTDGWWHIKRSDGTTGWVGETFIQETSAAFNEDPVDEPEPEPEPEPAPEPEPINEDPLWDITGHKYEEAIWYIYNAAIVGGYPDNSYQPDLTINRAELLKIIIEAVYTTEFEGFENRECFSDVASGEWYTKYICFAKREAIVEGYDDGTFRPAEKINFVEALKIAMIGFGYDYVEGDPWYYNIVDTASTNNFIPFDVENFDSEFTRGQMADMITRILKYQDDELDEYLGDDIDSSITYEDLGGVVNKNFVEADCSELGEDWDVYTKPDIELSICYNSKYWGEPGFGPRGTIGHPWQISFYSENRWPDEYDPYLFYYLQSNDPDSPWNSIDFDLSEEELLPILYGEDADLDQIKLEKVEIQGIPAIRDWSQYYIPGVLKDGKYNLSISASPEFQYDVEQMLEYMSI